MSTCEVLEIYVSRFVFKAAAGLQFAVGLTRQVVHAGGWGTIHMCDHVTCRLPPEQFWKAPAQRSVSAPLPTPVGAPLPAAEQPRQPGGHRRTGSV